MTPHMRGSTVLQYCSITEVNFIYLTVHNQSKNNSQESETNTASVLNRGAMYKFTYLYMYSYAYVCLSSMKVSSQQAFRAELFCFMYVHTNIYARYCTIFLTQTLQYCISR